MIKSISPGYHAMRLNQIRDLIAVIDSGSIHGAARVLGISQPAITKSLRNLEAELHLLLVRRTSKGVLPTPAGRAFVARARVAQAELLKASEEAAAHKAGYAGAVAFGVGPTAGFMIVPEAVARFRKEYVNAHLRIADGYTHTLLPLVRDETLDFAIGARPHMRLEADIAFRPLFRHDFVVVGRKGHPLRKARSLSELSEADWISFHSWGAAGSPLARAFASAGLRMPKNIIQCESYVTAIGLLSTSDVLGIESRRMLAGSFAKDYLQAIEVDDACPSYTAGIFVRADSPPTKLATAMIKAIMAAANRLGRHI